MRLRLATSSGVAHVTVGNRGWHTEVLRGHMGSIGDGGGGYGGRMGDGWGTDGGSIVSPR